MSNSAPNYWDYLKLDSLLSLQNGLEPTSDDVSADELHFIIVHQVYELWFKLVVRSIRLARDHLARPRVAEETIPHVVHHLRRTTRIMNLFVEQMEVMETLTPQDFLEFRNKLSPASGFQSFQMRELEIVLGLDEAQRIQYGKVHPIQHIKEFGRGTPAGDLARETLERAGQEQTFLEALNDWLYRTPIQGSTPDCPDDEERVVRFLETYLDALMRNHEDSLTRLVAALGERAKPELEEKFEGIRAAARAYLMADDVASDKLRIRRVRAAALFIESYRELPLLAWPRLLLDAVVSMEEEMVLFRHRHARMVERVIGRRPGTGGSGGVSYLDRTGAYRVFRDLWAVRTVLMPRRDLPELEMPEFYGFATPD